MAFWQAFGKRLSGSPLTEAVFHLAEGVGAHWLEGLGEAGTHGSQTVNPRTKEGSVVPIERYIYRSLQQSYTSLMPNAKKMTLAQYHTQYARLSRQLANLGWISEGYVQNRGPGAGGP